MINQQGTYQSKYRITPVAVALVSIFFSVCLLACVAVAARYFPINRTTSMPFGVYRVVSKSVARGDIVGGCVPNEFAALGRMRGYLHSGICRSGTRPVMKFVAAVPGDSVEIRWSGVSVNGMPIPDTAVLRTDSLGHAIPNQIGMHLVQTGEYWLVSNYDQGSFDSRYFGPVKEIVDVVEPILTATDRRGSHSTLLRLGAGRP